jgi:hypothetical protein
VTNTFYTLSLYHSNTLRTPSAFNVPERELHAPASGSHSPMRTVHAPPLQCRYAASPPPPPLSPAFHHSMLCFSLYLLSLLCLCCFVFVGVLYLSVLVSLFLFWNFLLILLISIAMVVLSWFSFSVVVISLSNSKTFQSFHAEILYLSYVTTYGEGCADVEDEDEDCSVVF